MSETPSSSDGPLQRTTKRTTAQNVAVTAEKAVWRVADKWPIFSFIVEWRERRYAEQQAAELVAAYHRLRTADASLLGEKLYERVIMDRLQCTPAQARDVIRGADVSFAQWPEERDVIFRDVVNYVITHELMAAHDKSLGTRADMVELFRDVVPGNL